MQIVDTFSITRDFLARYSELSNSMAEGLWFVVDPPLNELLAPASGQSATIVRPDGSIIVARIVGIEVRHAVLALQFEGIGKEDIPLTSHLAWNIEEKPV